MVSLISSCSQNHIYKKSAFLHNTQKEWEIIGLHNLTIQNMHQNTIDQVSSWLPKLEASKVDLTSANDEFEQAFDKSIEQIHSWAATILQKNNLPSSVNEAKALLKKYEPDSEEGSALRCIVELDAMQVSVNIGDASTAAITSMKLLEAIWQHAITKKDEPIEKKAPPKKAKTTKKKKTNVQGSSIIDAHDQIRKYQETINELKDKYPHCNVNALRLLVATRLNVPKQLLDELGISPE